MFNKILYDRKILLGLCDCNVNEEYLGLLNFVFFIIRE